MRVLYIAEIVGKVGITCVKKALPMIKASKKIDFVIANADGATGCGGLGKNHAAYLRKLGCNVITGGDFLYLKKDLAENLNQFSYIVQPCNYSGFNYENQSAFFTKIGFEKKIAVISFLGFSNFQKIHANNPFTSFLKVIENIRKITPCIFIDFHSATTAEKKSFSFFVDGKVSVVVGSHGRVQTADERIMKNGTAAITDAGRTGAVNSVGGAYFKSKIVEYVTEIPDWTREVCCTECENMELQGIIVDIDNNGFCNRIERLKCKI